jgi:hypothetical protein
MNWSTEKIIEDLKKIAPEANICCGDPGGDYDTKNIYLKPNEDNDDDDDEDCICICGFNPEKTIEYGEEPQHDIPYVEIRNRNSDSSGGLSFDASEEIRKLYFIAIKYFSGEKVVIIPHYNCIF